MTSLVPSSTEPGPGQRARRRQRQATTRSVARWALYLLLLVVFVVPLWSIVASALSGDVLRPGRLAGLPVDPTFANVTAAWSRYNVSRYLGNSLVMAGLAVPLQTFVSALAAYALARKRFRGAAVVLLLILCTMMMPEEIIAVPLYLVLSDVPLFGVSLLNSYAGLVLPVLGWAFSIFVLMQFMKEIPLEIEEAAQIDGAGDVGIFFRIVLPSVKPAIGTVLIFSFLMVWDQYLLPLLVATDPQMNTLQVALLELRRSDHITTNIVMAAALFALLPSITVYLLLQKHFERGLMAGSVKG